jgi:hypothetical protein
VANYKYPVSLSTVTTVHGPLAALSRCLAALSTAQLPHCSTHFPSQPFTASRLSYLILSLPKPPSEGPIYGTAATVHVNIKGGHPQFKSATRQYCGQPNRLRSWELKKVAELRFRTFKIWLPQFRNSPKPSANSAILSGTFSSAQDGFKNQQKYF